jgi:hypothetical protein
VNAHGRKVTDWKANMDKHQYLHGASIGQIYLLLFFLFLFREKLRFLIKVRRYAKADVIGHTESHTKFNTLEYHAQLKFTDEYGKHVTIVDKEAYTKKTPPIGAKIGVIYPLDSPEAARSLRSIAIIFLLFPATVLALFITDIITDHVFDSLIIPQP